MFADRGPKIYMPPILVALPTNELPKQRQSLPDPGADKGKKKRQGNQNADIGGDHKNIAAMTLLRTRIPPMMGLLDETYLFLGDRREFAFTTARLVRKPGARAFEEEGRAWHPALPLLLLPLPPKCNWT